MKIRGLLLGVAVTALGLGCLLPPAAGLDALDSGQVSVAAAKPKPFGSWGWE